MAKCAVCYADAMDGFDRCELHERTYRRSLRQQEVDNTKGLMKKGFEVGAGFTLGSILILIPIAIIVLIAAAVCQL